VVAARSEASKEGRLRIGVLGAGAIGTYLGAALIAPERDVVLVGRRPLGPEIERSGLTLTDVDGAVTHVPFSRVTFRTEPSALADVDIVLCCVKSGQTADAARELDGVLGSRSIVVSLQNGMGNAAALRAGLPGRTVLGGIVGFNVVVREGGIFRRTTSGPLAIEASDDPRVRALADALESSGFELKLARDIEALQWSKLIMNLNNSVSALSDVPTKDLIVDKGYRRIIAGLVREALYAMRAAGIRPAKLTPLPVSWYPFMLSLPSFLVRPIVGTQLKIDPEARSSMWEDLSKRRLTEVDYLNGEVVRLAESRGLDAPLNRRMVEIVHRCEAERNGSPRFGADALWAELTKPPGGRTP
jgi:2-dehydropantoate 2-reductase